MHFASSAHPSTSDTSSAAPAATRSRRPPIRTPRKAKPAYARLRFVNAHEVSGEADQRIERPHQRASPQRQPRYATDGAPRAAGRRRKTAPATSARPPIHTSGPSARPPAKKRAQKARVSPATPRHTRSPSARTGGDASIAPRRIRRRSQTGYTRITATTPPSERLLLPS